MAKKIIRKSRVVKTRNNGTMTESAFWSFIRSSLRRRTMVWKPIAQCKQNSKRAYKGTNPRQKWEYQCNSCKQYFPDKMVTVDHINPAGTLTCANDLPQFVEKLFCEVKDLQTLCKHCHDEKTKNDKLKLKK